MYEFRDKMAEEIGMELIVHINPEGVEKDINPFTHGSAIHTDVMKTEGLKQALDKYGFDAAFGGARRDEEKSRAKERVFSFAPHSTAGIRKISGRNCGSFTTRASTLKSPFVSSRSRTGPSWIFGSTSTCRTFPLFRFITLPSVR
ncbi:hypothetical protein HAALTHF_29760n [Vreelandella aquamarina]|nr:hypothetical protein HAALTHF_29760n [Halomonas axialensis]